MDTNNNPNNKSASKVLRLHHGALDTLEGWAATQKLQSKSIDSIKDPAGATKAKEVTSIPSPFARIDLVKTAFEYVTKEGLVGNTIFHKLVSDSLDVGQIFFNIEKFRDSIQIIEWKKNQEISTLINSSVPEHRRLGKTLDTFFSQDDGYNFDLLQSIYLLNYIGKDAPNININIIGATSPATLFFTSANKLDYVSKNIVFGQDRPFDGGYQPLYKRDTNYIKFWFKLRASLGSIRINNNIYGFASLFGVVDEYLNATFREISKMNPQLSAELQNLNPLSYSNEYVDVSVEPGSQQFVDILPGIRLKRIKSAQINSGFAMVVKEGFAGGQIPLALPIDDFSTPVMYTTDWWDRNTKVKYYDSTPIQNRILPNDGSHYPYVTIGDFLEDGIFRIPWKLNTSYFFDGNYSGTEVAESYLLPLKPVFFDYFKPSDLKGDVAPGVKMIQVKRIAGGSVEVTLNIPIQNGYYVQYKRLYIDAPNAVPDRNANKGVVIEREFTLGILPPINYTGDIKPKYRVSVLDKDSVSGEDNNYSLSFYDDKDSEVNPEACVERNKNAQGVRIDSDFIDSKTYVLNNKFEYLYLSDSKTGCKALILPIFRNSSSGSASFKFAVDFGTTNTHIEYQFRDREDNEITSSFDVNKDIQMQKLHITDDYDFINVFNSDFIPDSIGDNSTYFYPMRTVLSQCRDASSTQELYSMAQTNIPYTYQKIRQLPYNNSYTDLKWSNGEEQKKAKYYIENLMFILRNKVLLNNGDLNKTQLVWFYPASMDPGRYDFFESVWREQFEEYFSKQAKIYSMSESRAPFIYFNKKRGLDGTSVSVDIGGGTTDILIVENEKKFLTSFRFAANTIFGDGYNHSSGDNGYVRKYISDIKQRLTDNDLSVLNGILDSLYGGGVSSDIIAFFFSLASNKDVINKRADIDFAKMLSNDDLGKYPILLFYVAILYHIACIMKSKSISMPRHIAFSGNGSRILSILTPNDRTLQDFTKLIFAKVYSKEYPSDGLTIYRDKHPKEATCKGGIEKFKDGDFESERIEVIEKFKTVLLGTDSSTFAEKLKYDFIDETTSNKVVNYLNSFIDFVFELNEEFPFNKFFVLNGLKMPKVKEVCKKDIKMYLENGIKRKKGELSADSNIEETLFFYPLIGILNAVAREVYK